MQFIHQQRQHYPLSLLCAAMDLPRSAYYRWVTPPVTDSPSDRAEQRQQEINRLVFQQFHYHRAPSKSLQAKCLCGFVG